MIKKYQVFVSSTYEDLRDERAAVMFALLKLKCIPSGMELFPASGDDVWEVIKETIDESDYYVLVIAGMYGSISEKDGISWTQKEYEYACHTGKPVFVFLRDDRENLPGTRIEKEHPEQLEAFIQKASGTMRDKWTTPDSLALAVTTAISNAIREKPGIGWTRGDELQSSSSTILPSQISKPQISPVKDIAAQIAHDAAISDEKVRYYAATFAGCFADELMADPIKPDTSVTVDLIKHKIAETSPLRDTYLDTLQKLSIDSKLPEVFAIATIESLLKRISNYPLASQFPSLGYKEPYQFLVWDLFLSTIAMFMFYNKYESMGIMLTRKYNAGCNYGRYSTDGDIELAYLRQYQATLNGMSRETTTSAQLLLQRKMTTAVTKDTITSADVLICQLSCIYSQNEELELWCPETLAYFDDVHTLNDFWQKLRSKSVCEEMLTLFEVGDIYNLKRVVEENKFNSEIAKIHVNRHTVPPIAQFIFSEDIATMK